LRRLGDDNYSRALRDHHRIIRLALEAHEGLEQGTQGDSFFATFTSPRACIAAAIEMQRALALQEWPLQEALRVRMGIHTGEVAEMSTGLVGYEVHRAARIAAVGHGGQVLLSSAAAGLVEDTLPADVTLRDLGSHRLKDLGRPETIFQLLAEGLDSEFEPLRSLDNPELTNNLPTSLSPFIGRSAELEEVRNLVTDSRLVTLTGSGGSGKTRLGLQVAAELLDGGGEGVWFVDLAPVTDPDQVPMTVVSAMQLSQHSGGSPLEGLVKMLRAQNVLIVLDNCEHLIDTVAKMADVIGRNCPQVSIIVTSREPLGVDGERVYRVRSMSLPPDDAEVADDLKGSDAVELFVSRARAKDSTFEINDTLAPLVASVCRQLDGIPLAIELAASRLSSMSFDDLHSRLDHRFQLLTGGSRNALPRQQTLAATVAWSYDLLTEPERDLLRRISVFVGGFDLRGAESVWAETGSQSFDVADLLSSLVNKSLVAAERASSSLRYRLLETIRQYAAEQLIQVGGENDVTRTRRLHAEHFLRLCLAAAPELKGPQQGVWLRRLDVEYDNLVAAFATLSADPTRRADVLAMGVALNRFMLTRRNSVFLHFIGDALSRDSIVPVALRVEALLTQSIMTRVIGTEEHSLRRALELSEQAYALAGQLDDEYMSRTLMCKAESLADLGRRDVGLVNATAALELARAINSPRLIAESLAAVAYCHDSVVASHDQLVEALSIFRQLGDITRVAHMVSSLSLAFHETTQDFSQARALNQEAMELAEEIGSTYQMTLILDIAASLSFYVGEFDLAEQQSQRALRLSRRNGSPTIDVYWITFYLACCATQQGDFVRGAHLTGAHAAIEDRAVEPIGGWWTPLEIEAREKNRVTLREALGDEEFERAISFGKSLSADGLYDLAMSRSSHLG
jgi:predicted ATPase